MVLASVVGASAGLRSILGAAGIVVGHGELYWAVFVVDFEAFVFEFVVVAVAVVAAVVGTADAVVADVVGTADAAVLALDFDLASRFVASYFPFVDVSFPIQKWFEGAIWADIDSEMLVQSGGDGGLLVERLECCLGFVDPKVVCMMLFVALTHVVIFLYVPCLLSADA